MLAYSIVSLLLEDEEVIDIKDEIGRLATRTPQVFRDEKLVRSILSGQARESQYAQIFLDGNGERGEGRGLTIKSFLAYRLRGLASKYESQYANALENAMLRRIDLGLARVGRSLGGKTTYYPNIDEITYQKTQWNIESLLARSGLSTSATASRWDVEPSVAHMNAIPPSPPPATRLAKLWARRGELPDGSRDPNAY